MKKTTDEGQFLYAQITVSSGPYCGLATGELAAPKQ